MKQKNYELIKFADVENVLKELYEYTQSISYTAILFHIYSILLVEDEMGQLQEMIKEAFPKAQIVGTSTNGDICDGHLAEYGFVMAVSIFESTDVDVILFPCERGKERDVGKSIRKRIDETDELCVAELLVTLKSISGRTVLEEVEKSKSEVMIFGGGSSAFRIEDDDTWVLDRDGVIQQGIALVLYRGNQLHVDVHHAIGWKPLGKDLKVTKIENKRLYELDSIPAAQMYSKYLDIQPDDDFFANILEFPIMYEQHGHEVLRMPFSCREQDDSILLAADLELGTTVNFSYGDPDVIRRDVENLAIQVEEFGPQAIFLYSCGIRRLYWKYLINKETGPFSALAPVAGFYSCGEIMRMDEDIIEHHVTLIAISMREGEKEERKHSAVLEKKIRPAEEEVIHGQMSMVHRLANFINVTAEELHQANLELQQMADTDELTGLYNRRMIDKIMENAIKYANKFHIPLTIGLVDIDDFKQINDTYGHGVGDEVLREISQMMKEEVEQIPGGICGRWGGEEFLCMIPNVEAAEALACVENIRTRVAETAKKKEHFHTICIGVSSLKENDSFKSIFQRADDALYEAKGTGKNRIVQF